MSRLLNVSSRYLTNSVRSSRQTEVTIRDVDDTAMEILVDFCYTAYIVVEEGNVQTLLPAACLLQLQEIQDVCCEFLKRQLDPSNCLGIRSFADTHACRDLLRLADKFTQNNFQVSRTWLKFQTFKMTRKGRKSSEII